MTTPPPNTHRVTWIYEEGGQVTWHMRELDGMPVDAQPGDQVHNRQGEFVVAVRDGMLVLEPR